MNAQTERLSLLGAAGVIEAVRDAAAVPAGAAARGVAVIAHPHPLFGGTLDNKVVQTLARAAVPAGAAAASRTASITPAAPSRLNRSVCAFIDQYYFDSC